MPTRGQMADQLASRDAITACYGGLERLEADQDIAADIDRENGPIDDHAGEGDDAVCG